MLVANVHSAKVMDRDGIEPLRQRTEGRFPRLEHLWLDADYNGKGKGLTGKTLSLKVEVVQYLLKIAPLKLMNDGSASEPRRG